MRRVFAEQRRDPGAASRGIPGGHVAFFSRLPRFIGGNLATFAANLGLAASSAHPLQTLRTPSSYRDLLCRPVTMATRCLSEKTQYVLLKPFLEDVRDTSKDIKAEQCIMVETDAVVLQGKEPDEPNKSFNVEGWSWWVEMRRRLPRGIQRQEHIWIRNSTHEVSVKGTGVRANPGPPPAPSEQGSVWVRCFFLLLAAILWFG